MKAICPLLILNNELTEIIRAIKLLDKSQKREIIAAVHQLNTAGKIE